MALGTSPFGATPGKPVAVPKPGQKPKPKPEQFAAAFEALTDDDLLELALKMGAE
jgi:hypothetical protein